MKEISLKTAVVIYTRVSSKEQVDNMSLSEQLRICKDFVARTPDLQVDRVFTEEGESAKTSDRTMLKELLEYCRANKNRIGHVVVYKLDRLARNLEDHVAIQALLKKMGIVLWSATEPIGITVTGKLMENMLASFAQFDNEQRSERCGAGMKARSLEGGWVVNAPIGYVNIKDDLKRPTLTFGDERTVKAVRKFFDEFVSGKYLQNDAVKVATACGLLTAQGKPLSRTGAIGMLNNIAYAGRVKNKMTEGREVQGLHPAMISIEQFRAIQAILAGRKHSFAKPPRFKPFWPLRRFLTCGHCGRPLTASAPTGGSGKKHPAYHCSHCSIKRNGIRVTMPKDKAHEDFLARLDSLIPSEWALKAFKEIVLRRWDREFRNVQDRRRDIDDELAQLENRRNKLFDMQLDGKLKDDKHFNEQIQRLDVQQQGLEMERDDIKATEVDKRRIVNEAVHFIAHAGDIWRSATAEHKVLFQKLVYEGGIALYPDQTFGTSNVSEIYQQLTEIEAYVKNNKAGLPIGNSALVHPARFERTTFSTAN